MNKLLARGPLQPSLLTQFYQVEAHLTKRQKPKLGSNQKNRFEKPEVKY